MNDFSERMTALRTRFVAQARGELAMLADDAQAGRWDAVRVASHGLAGRAGMFGFAAMGDAARLLEEAIEAGSNSVALAPLVERLQAHAATLPPA